METKTPKANASAQRVRETLEQVANAWTLLVLDGLDGEGPTRFSKLRDRVPGITHKMLTQTLRALERDGLVTREVFPEVPPRVEYELTPMGQKLNAATCSFWTWVEAYAPKVEKARASYDARTTDKTPWLRLKPRRGAA